MAPPGPLSIMMSIFWMLISAYRGFQSAVLGSVGSGKSPRPTWKAIMAMLWPPTTAVVSKTVSSVRSKEPGANTMLVG